MKETTAVGIVIICIVVTFGATYVTVGMFKEQEYENQINDLNNQVNNLNLQIDVLDDQIEKMEAQMEILTGRTSDSTPNIIISMSDDYDYLKVISADLALYWSDVQIITEAGASCDTSGLGTFITAGDKITSCSGEISLYWVPSNALIGTWIFT